MQLPLIQQKTGEEDKNQDDWRWQARSALTTLAELSAVFTLTPQERVGIENAASGGFPISITPYYASLCDPVDPRCPIRQQVVPVAAESVRVLGDLDDPLGEVSHEVAPHLVQRYPDRVLLLVTDRCAVYCRFCTRSRMVGDGGGSRSKTALAPAIEYIKSHKNIREVIVSGGDPFVAATSKITSLIAKLAEIEHLDTIRLATRTPVTLPQRITDELCDGIREATDGMKRIGIWVMTHFNHPKELTGASTQAIHRLVDAGIPVMNQTVLLRGINDRADVLEALFRGLVRRRARPYYLLQADPVKGTGHLRTPLADSIALMGALQGRLSGIALPKLIVDTPGGLGKVPVGPRTILSQEGGVTLLETFRGDRVEYIDPPTVC